MKQTRNALIASGLSLMVSLVLMVGMTYAWFSDSITNNENTITTGQLDVNLMMDQEKNGQYSIISNQVGSLFNDKKGENGYDWESGKTEFIYLAVSNDCLLNIKYNIDLDITGELAGALEYALVLDANQSQPITSWEDAKNRANGLTGDVKENIQFNEDIEILVKTDKANMHYFALVIHMKEDATSEVQGKSVNLNLTVNATQTSNKESQSTHQETRN